MSGDEGRLVGGQEVNGVRDLIDACQPPQRRAPSDALLLLLSHTADHLTVEIAGSDGIDPDLTGAELAGKAARQTIERRFGCAIDGHACVAADGMHRGYVDDASGALPQHQPGTSLREHQGRSKVHFDGLDNVARAHRRQNAFHGNSGVVDEHIDATQPLAHLLHAGAQRLVIASVHLAPKEMPALAGTRHIGDESCLRPAQRRYAVLPLEKPRHQFGSQAATPPANQRDLSGLWHGRRVLTLNLRSDVCAAAMPNRCLIARFLETRTVMILQDHLDDGGYFVALEPRVAKLAHAPFERVGILRPERGDFGCNDLAGDRIGLAAHRDVFDVVDLEQNILDFGRMHFLAAHVYQLRLAAENANVLAISFDEVLRVEPAVDIER